MKQMREARRAAAARPLTAPGMDCGDVASALGATGMTTGVAGLFTFEIPGVGIGFAIASAGAGIGSVAADLANRAGMKC